MKIVVQIEWVLCLAVVVTMKKRMSKLKYMTEWVYFAVLLKKFYK